MFPDEAHLAGLVVKYLRAAAASKQSRLSTLDIAIAAALDHGTDAIEIAALIAGVINRSARKQSSQADELRKRYLRRESKFWAEIFRREYHSGRAPG
jgi:hypothetical protein